MVTFLQFKNYSLVPKSIKETPLIIHSHPAIKRGVAVGNQIRGVDKFKIFRLSGATKKEEPASTHEARSVPIFIIRTLTKSLLLNRI